MGLAGVKNDIKTLFLIINTVVGLLPGLLVLSYGFAAGLEIRHGYYNAEAVWCPVVGLLILGVTVLGYVGAINGNRVLLYIYSGVMALTALLDFLALCLIDSRYMPVTVPIIFNIGGALLTLALAIILAGLTPKDVNQGDVLSTPPNTDTPII